MKKNKKATALVEILLAIAIFVLIASSVSFFAIDSLRYSRNARRQSSAILYIQENYNAMYLNKNYVWLDLVQNTDAGVKHLDLINNKYLISSGTVINDGIEVGFTINRVNRDSSGNIITSGGSEDLHTRKIVFSATWDDLFGNPVSIERILYVNDWNTPSWSQTTQSDFNSGVTNLTQVTSDVDGEIKLNDVFYADWCKPEFTQTTYDIPGIGVPSIISSVTGEVYLGSTSNALDVISVDHTNDPPQVNLQGQFSGYSTKGIFGEGNYAYLATRDNSKELVIVDVTTVPYKEVGYYNAYGTTDAESVYVSGNVAFIAQGRTLRAIDVSSKTGARTQLGSITVGITNSFITKVVVRENYAYVTMDNDWDELAIVNVSNPASMQIVGTADVSTQQSYGLFVSEDSNRVYIGTNSTSQYNEFFIINTTTKTGSRPIIGSYNSNGMTVKGITVIDNRAILVGSGGEEYQVLDISNESSPVRCGGIQTDSLNGVTSVVTLDNRRYTYIISSNSNGEFKVIRGGLSAGEGGGGLGYSPNGDFTSSIYDSGSATTKFLSLEWLASIPANTTVKIQIRAGNNANLSDGTWVGPDGTGSTYFTTQSLSYIPTIAHNKRYIQYKVFFTSDTVSTPVFEKITIDYQ